MSTAQICCKLHFINPYILLNYNLLETTQVDVTPPFHLCSERAFNFTFKTGRFNLKNGSKGELEQKVNRGERRLCTIMWQRSITFCT